MPSSFDLTGVSVQLLRRCLCVRRRERVAEGCDECCDVVGIVVERDREAYAGAIYRDGGEGADAAVEAAYLQRSRGRERGAW